MIQSSIHQAPGAGGSHPRLTKWKKDPCTCTGHCKVMLCMAGFLFFVGSCRRVIARNAANNGNFHLSSGEGVGPVASWLGQPTPSPPFGGLKKKPDDNLEAIYSSK